MKTYLVKKDVNKPDTQDNWIIMSGSEFMRFMETEDGKSRKKNFAKLDRCGDYDDDIIVECGENRSKKWERQRLRERYHSCANSQYSTISYDSPLPDQKNYCGDAIIPDPTADTEKKLISKQEMLCLQNAFQSLSATEQEMIRKLFLDEKPMSERAYADANGLHQSTTHRRKARILSKLRKEMKSFGFDTDYFS